MSSYNNRIVVIGNIGQDPQVFDVGGNTLVKFSVAVYRSGKDENKKTDWIPCTAWHDMARGIKTHISKGDAVIVSGSFQVDSKKNDDGSYSKFHALNVDYIGKQIFGIAKEENNREAGGEDPF